MSNPNTQASFGQLDPSLLDGAFHVNIVAPADGTYDVCLQSPGSGTIQKVVAILASGSCTIQTRINNVPVELAGGGSTMSITSSANSKAAASANSFGDESRLTIVVSSSSTPAALAVSIHYRRTG